MWRKLVLLALLLGVYPGGWAAITVEDLPDYLVASQPVRLAFTVRQHGHRPLSGLRAMVEARAGDAAVQVMASPGGQAGRYEATLTLPHPGDWTITINSGFGNSRLTLPPLRAIATGSVAPAPLPEVERGRRLFIAKGCVTCHVHQDVEGSGTVAVGPDLTNRRQPVEYLKLFLANPAIKPTSGSLPMPNLELKAPEIAALAAFLSAERHARR